MSDFKNGELSFSKLIVWLFYDDQVVLATLLCQHFVEDFPSRYFSKGRPSPHSGGAPLPVIPAKAGIQWFRHLPGFRASTSLRPE
jgi:hypothetical protein